MDNRIKFCILAEVRENHKSILKQENTYNDYVSQKSMLELAEGISSLGFECEFIGGMEEMVKLSENIDFKNTIFINYNYGSPSQFKRGQSPIFLEMNHALYSGSDPFVSLLVNDKYCSKKVVSKNGYKTANSLLIHSKDDTKYINESNINIPIVIKPNAEGSSLGIDNDSYCETYERARAQCMKLLNSFSPLIAEEYVSGYELTVWIIGNKNNFKLICPLLVSIDNIYYFESKVVTIFDKANHKRCYSLPQNFFPNYIMNNIIEVSKQIFVDLGMRDYGRIDFRIKNSEIFFIEANALPIFSKTSEIGEICKLYNMSYEKICGLLIDSITERLMPKTD